jgi:hypothetical protein
MEEISDDKLQEIVANMPPAQRSRLVMGMNSTGGGGGVFAWQGWAPQPGSAVHASLHKHFPGALPGPSVHFRSMKVLTEKFKFTADNTLLGSSVCPDEINNLDFGVVALMVKHWGEVFPMGGIGGAPHVGKTGFKAFSSHVPDNGNVLVVFAPHVALSPTGEVGKYLRDGQAKESSSCGACIGAFNACCGVDDPVEAFKEVDEADTQMSWVKQQIAPNCVEIKQSSAPMAKLAFKCFDNVKDKVQEVVNTKFGSGYLVLLGGIQINMPAPCAEHFLPLIFEARQEGKETINLMDELALQ